MPITPRHIHGLPHQAVNRLLSLRLVHGVAHLSTQAIRHIRKRHPADALLCLASIETIITAPDFIGQEPHHLENFELVKQIGEVMVLVAVASIPNEYGKYPILSSYVIPHNALQRRLRKKHLTRYQ